MPEGAPDPGVVPHPKDVSRRFFCLYVLYLLHLNDILRVIFTIYFNINSLALEERISSIIGNFVKFSGVTGLKRALEAHVNGTSLDSPGDVVCSMLARAHRKLGEH